MFDTTIAQAPPEHVPLSRCLPSGWLGLELDTATSNLGAHDDFELIETVVAFDRMASWAQARQARALAEFARRRPADVDPAAVRSRVPASCGEFAADEVALALRLSRIAAGARLDIATRLSSALPETLEAWEHGTIDSAKVRAIVEACRPLPMELARAVQERVLPRAPEQTQGQLRAALARAVIAVDPDGVEKRHAHARADRRVVLNPEPDGMASLWALLPAPDAVAAYEHLGRLARELGAADPRRMDARRADVLTELLTGRRCAVPGCCSAADTAAADTAAADTAADTDTDTAAADTADTGTADTADTAADDTSGAGHDSERAGRNGGHADREARGADREAKGADPDGEDAARGDSQRRCHGCGGRQKGRSAKATVHVTVPITTLMGLDDNPAELRGYGPIPAALAREIAADGVWRRLLTDPESGVLLDHGRTTYTPPVGLADFVRARDVHCRSPICRRSANQTDLDHTIAWAEGGTTSAHNLYSGCRHDHRLKTHARGWRVAQSPDGTVTYTTPTGHQYKSQPHDYRTEPFAPRPSLPIASGPVAGRVGSDDRIRIGGPDVDPPPF